MRQSVCPSSLPYDEQPPPALLASSSGAESTARVLTLLGEICGNAATSSVHVTHPFCAGCFTAFLIFMHSPRLLNRETGYQLRVFDVVRVLAGDKYRWGVWAQEQEQEGIREVRGKGWWWGYGFHMFRTQDDEWGAME